ncbi:MAG: hypothetical protein KBT34_14670 [Prevotella sp.]|nr:hypothetical protein [Candidatus Prevotella equi]
MKIYKHRHTKHPYITPQVIFEELEVDGSLMENISGDIETDDYNKDPDDEDESGNIRAKGSFIFDIDEDFE